MLGNESEALRMARNELDKLIDEAKGREGEGAQSEVLSEKSKKGAKQTAQEGKPPSDKPSEQDGQGENDLAQGKGEPKPGEQGKGEGQKQGDQPGGKGMAQNEGEPKAGEQGNGQKAGDDGRGPSTPRPGPGTADASSAKGQGDKPGGKGEGKGEQPGQPSGQGEGKGQMADAEGQDGQPGERQQGSQPTPGSSRSGQRGGSNRDGGSDEGGWFFDAGTEVADASPITGSNFDNWSDRLRNVEEMLTRPELRNEVAKVLDQARDLRADARRNDAVPQVEHLQMRILNPLVELRDKVTEELARKEGKNPLAPVDRDPVPEQYRELVQKYYEQLGAGK